MPKPKSKRKTTRPSTPPARQAPRSAKLIRLAGETVAQGMDLVAADRPTDALALTDAFLAKNRATADVLHLRGYAKVMLERTQEALEDFRKAVKLEPDTPAYRNSLGIAAQMDGDHEQARQQFARACRLDTANPTYWFNLGNALRDLGASAEAAEAYEAALRHLPDDPEVLNNLGIVLRDDGRVDEAVDMFRKARDLNDGDPRVLANLGIALQECADRDPDGEAEGLLKAAIARSPDAERTEPMRALMQLYLFPGKGALAVAVARQLAARAPDAATKASLALALLEANMADEAVDLSSALHREQPDDQMIAALYIRALVESHRYDEAVALTDRLLDESPECQLFLRWRLELLYRSDRIDQLRNEFARAKASMPGSPFAALFESRLALIDEDLERAADLLKQDLGDEEAHPVMMVELAMAQLSAGNLVEGWSNYRYRNPFFKGAGRTGQAKINIVNDDHPYLPIPAWRGEPLAGKRLFIMAEQGVGDEVMFASCIPDLIADADHCIIECDPRLVPLYRRSFPEATIRPAVKSIDFRLFYRAYAWLRGKDGADLATSSGDLPVYLRQQQADFDNAKAYLKPRAERVAFWRQRFIEVSQGRPLVGICWQGSLTSNDRKKYYQTLDQWSPLLIDSDLCLINLQSRRFEEAIQSVQRTHNFNIAYWKDIDLHNDFDEAAAYISALDAVIAPPTFTGQLAGAVGVRTLMPMSTRGWVCCGFYGRMPYYPSLKVFHRAPGAPWLPAMESIASELKTSLQANVPVKAAG